MKLQITILSLACSFFMATTHAEEVAAPSETPEVAAPAPQEKPQSKIPDAVTDNRAADSAAAGQQPSIEVDAPPTPPPAKDTPPAATQNPKQKTAVLVRPVPDFPIRISAREQGISLSGYLPKACAKDLDLSVSCSPADNQVDLKFGQTKKALSDCIQREKKACGAKGEGANCVSLETAVTNPEILTPRTCAHIKIANIKAVGNFAPPVAVAEREPVVPQRPSAEGRTCVGCGDVPPIPAPSPQAAALRPIARCAAQGTVVAQPIAGAPVTATVGNNWMSAMPMMFMMMISASINNNNGFNSNFAGPGFGPGGMAFGSPFNFQNNYSMAMPNMMRWQTPYQMGSFGGVGFGRPNLGYSRLFRQSPVFIRPVQTNNYFRQSPPAVLPPLLS